MISKETYIHINTDIIKTHFDTHNLTRSPWFANKLLEGLWINWVSHPYYRHISSGGPLNARFTLFNGRFHAHLLNWPKCIVWQCLIRQTAGISPCGYIIPASRLLDLHVTFLILQPEVPFGNKQCRQGIWSCCLNKTHHSLTALSGDIQRNIYCNKGAMKKGAQNLQKATPELHLSQLAR